MNIDFCKELYNELDIDDFILGYWKVESKFVKAKFIRQKCYIELSEVNEEIPEVKEEYLTYLT